MLDGWIRIKGARDLPVPLRAVLKCLFVARDRIARRLDRAPSVSGTKRK